MTATPQFGRLAIIGVGLIGGSLARALKNRQCVSEVIGVDCCPDNLAVAQQLGVVDAVAPLEEAVTRADLIVLATPIGQMQTILEVIRQHASATAVVTDAGSTKQEVIHLAAASLGERIGRFVPAHPIAGAETSGAAAARADLFDQRCVVLTPTPQTDPDATQKVAQLWEAAGAQVSRLDAVSHDAVFAAVSHFPHLLAFAYMHDIAGRPDADLLLSMAGSGFRDFTRIAAGQPQVWRDICMTNRAAMLAEIDRFAQQLDALRTLIAKDDGEALKETFARAAAARRAWRQD